MGRILAIDYGVKRCGIAVTDPLQLIATALDTVATGDLVEFLRTYIHKESVECIVIGLPRDMQNRATDGTLPVIQFVAKARKVFPQVEIKTIDERFTSRIAAQALAIGKFKKKDRQKKGNIDKVSATLILQTYLEQTKP